MINEHTITQSDLCDWLAGTLRDTEKLAAIEADLLLGENSQTLSWLKQLERSVSLLDDIRTPEGMRRWRERRRKRQRAETLARVNDLDVFSPMEQRQNEVPSAASTDGPSIDDFVQREVLRLYNTIENSSALLGRKELRWIRDNIVEIARAANPQDTTEDDRALHIALARFVRPIRRENARVTFKSALPPTERKKAKELLDLLDIQDHILADLRADEAFAHVALWYQLAEDAALSDDEIAALWAEDPAIVREALIDPRAEIQVERHTID